LTLVIIPNAEIKDSLESTWVIPALFILNLFRDQFPVEIAFSKAEVIVSALKQVCTSNGFFISVTREGNVDLPLEVRLEAFESVFKEQ
jgi:hypothetical protein